MVGFDTEPRRHSEPPEEPEVTFGPPGSTLAYRGGDVVPAADYTEPELEPAPEELDADDEAVSDIPVDPLAKYEAFMQRSPREALEQLSPLELDMLQQACLALKHAEDRHATAQSRRKLELKKAIEAESAESRTYGEALIEHLFGVKAGDPATEVAFVSLKRRLRTNPMYMEEMNRLLSTQPTPQVPVAPTPALVQPHVQRRTYDPKPYEQVDGMRAASGDYGDDE